MIRLFRKLAAQSSPQVLMVMQLVMDVDLILPILVRAQKQPKFPATAACLTTELTRQVPGLQKRLHKLGIETVVFPKETLVAGKGPALQGVQAVVTASETTAPPHRPCHRLIQQANDAGAVTYTLQHGLENIGLTYFDHVHTPQQIGFASQRIFLWGNPTTLHKDVSPDTRGKCQPVGCPEKPVQLNAQTLLPRGAHNIAVFENLHWHRYSDDFRNRFLEHLQRTAEQHPHVTFWVKPHPAGRWLTERFSGHRPVAANLKILDPAARRYRSLNGAELLACADAAITTPSTVALDAARAGRPVCVAGYDLDLPRYEPLQVLRSLGDWSDFVSALTDTQQAKSLIAEANKFRDRVMLAGDATGRILSQISADLHHN